MARPHLPRKRKHGDTHRADIKQGVASSLPSCYPDEQSVYYLSWVGHTLLQPLCSECRVFGEVTSHKVPGRVGAFVHRAG